MEFVLLRGIGMSQANRDAWRLAGFQIVQPTNRGRLGGVRERPSDTVFLNYGNLQLPRHLDVSLILNKPETISRTRVENLPHYVETPTWSLGDDGHGDPFPCIVKYNGMKGRGKYICHNMEELERACSHRGACVSQRFIHPAEEYRVVTMSIPGKALGEEDEVWVVGTSKKTVDPMNPRAPKDFQYIRVHETPGELRRIAREKHRQLGMNYIGWDFLHETETGAWHVIEANSCPGLGTELANRLRKKMAKVFELGDE